MELKTLKELKLTDTWETTNVIAKKIGKHWYTTKDILNTMVLEGKAVKLKLGRTTYWKIK